MLWASIERRVARLLTVLGFAHAVEILALAEETPDMTLAEITAHLEAEYRLKVAQSMVWRFSTGTA